MAGFRLVQIAFHLAYFVFAARLLMDGRAVRFATRLTALTIAVLAACQIVSYFGAADLSLYIPGAEHARGYLLGHTKPAIGRLFLAGIFFAIALLYRSVGSPIYIIAFLTLVAGIFFAGARAPLVGLAVGLVVMGAGTRIGGKVIVSGLIAAVFCTMIYLAASDPARADRFMEIVREPSEAYRWKIWSWIIGYLFLHPYVFISGVGFTNFKYALITDEVAIAEHAHNDFLTCTTELGLLGLAFLIMYLYRLGRDIYVRYRTTVGLERWHGLCLGAALAGLIVSGLFEYSFYYNPGAISVQRMLAVMFGVHTAYWVQERYYAAPVPNADAEGPPASG
jgi:O-antigen ligase